MTRQGGPFVQSPADEAVLNLGLGQPSPSLLPLAAIEAAARNRLGRGNDPLVLQYGTTWGHPGFREALATFLTEQTGVQAQVDDLAITAGISSALGLVSQVFARPGQPVVCGDPTYFLARGIFESAHLPVVGVPVDEHGMNVDVLQERLKGGLSPGFVYVMPSFHNPCGVTLAPQRARRLVELAAAHDFVIVADEPYVMLHFDRPPPSMMDYDQGRARVLSLGSFSKILGPGLRLGWVHAHAALVERFVDHGVLQSGGGLNPVVASIVHDTIDTGFLREHVECLRRSLAGRARALCDALDREIPQLDYRRPGGGYFVWGRFPTEVDTASFVESCRSEHGVGFTPGPRCAIDRDLSRYMRLSFAFYEQAELAEAVRRLANSLKARAPTRA